MWYFVLVHHKAALTPLHVIMVTAYVIEIGFPGGWAIGSYDCVGLNDRFVYQSQ